MTIYAILEELRKSNSSNYKLEVLKTHANNAELREFFGLTYDGLQYKFYLSNKNLNYAKQGSSSASVFLIKELLEPLYTRKITGNAALKRVQDFIDISDFETQQVLKCILDRDCHSNVSGGLIKKVFKDLFFRMPYMRCSLVNSLKNIKFPAIVQLKADGTYRTFVKSGDEIKAYSRSSEEYTHETIFEALKNAPDGAYIGELIANLDGEDAADLRYKSNGALNSKNPPKDVTFYAWDYLTLDELIAKSSDKPYTKRLDSLSSAIGGNSECIKIIETHLVQSYAEALKIFKDLVKNGYEGAVLKDLDAKFENKTSKFQIKLKNEAEIDLECVGFTQGNGKFADTFGAILFKSSDGKVQGQCSGIDDKTRKEISQHRDKYIGKIFAVKANDITKSKNSEIYGLMHPQFKGFRNDKSIADDLDRIQKMFLSV